MLLCLLEVLGLQYKEELVLNVTGFIVRLLGAQYIEELIFNVIVCLWCGSVKSSIERN